MLSVQPGPVLKAGAIAKAAALIGESERAMAMLGVG